MPLGEEWKPIAQSDAEGTLIGLTQNYGRQILNACLCLTKVTGDTWLLWDMLENE